ncbi:hypothetical protein PLEOSDRAFT_1089817 [Pleurotus ostreatus PC15]|uniref:Uncharacterized protein n=1 Tax=Pleurotus ostreatus (strain PC15) TaxID=1137138 RepID=A0A067NI06_PLEO1|nr:hypothetical protein PLEOSDRAFT_1089817 [Pleurotus ostreatus PC15]
MNPPQTPPPRKRKISMRLPSSKSFKRLAKNVKEEMRELVGLGHHVTPAQGAAVSIVPLFGALSFSPSSSPSRTRRNAFDIDHDADANSGPPSPLALPASSRSRTSSATLSVDSLHLHKSVIEGAAHKLGESECSAPEILPIHPEQDDHSFVSEGTTAHATQDGATEGLDSIAFPKREGLESTPPRVCDLEPPDPFLTAEPYSTPDTDNITNSISESSQALPIVQSPEIIINSPTSDSHSLPFQPLLSPNVHHDVIQQLPPLPEDDDKEDEEAQQEDALKIILPGLILPTMFLPTPNVRPPLSSSLLSPWLSRSYYRYNCTTRLVR